MADQAQRVILEAEDQVTPIVGKANTSLGTFETKAEASRSKVIRITGSPGARLRLEHPHPRWNRGGRLQTWRGRTCRGWSWWRWSKIPSQGLRATALSEYQKHIVS